MDTRTKRPRTRATVAVVVLALAALASLVVGGPVQAGAQDPQVASLPAFAQSDSFSFTTNGWLGLASDIAPSAAFASGSAGTSSDDPVVELGTPVLSSCDSSPVLSLPYTVTASASIASIEVTFDSAFEAFNYVGDLFSDETFLDSAEQLPLDELKDALVARQGLDPQLAARVSLRLYADDSQGRVGFKDLDITVDFSDCTVTINDPEVPVESSGNGDAPVIDIDSVELASCDATPVASISYTISDTDGIAQASMFMPDADNPFIKLRNGDRGQQKVRGTVKVPLEFATETEITTWLSIDASDSDGNSAWSDLDMHINLGTCTVELDG